jgi:transposase
MKLKRIGIDLAKSVFQIHGVDEHEQMIVRKALSRTQLRQFLVNVEPTLIGIEACGSSHHWARELIAMGHTVKLIPPQFVKPYVKRHKNDAVDAEAICEAVSRPTMRFVTIKSVDQQVMQSIHRVRSRLVKSRTALVNEVRGLLAEFGIVIQRLGVSAVRRTLPRLLEDADNELSPLLRDLLGELYRELIELDGRLDMLMARLADHAKTDERVARLQQVPGVGPIIASAIVASIGDAKQFKTGRDFAAWLGIVPNQHSSGGKQRLGGISKRGDTYLRTLIIHGARSCVNVVKNKTDRRSEWIKAVIKRRNKNIATVALANKQARIIWAMLTREVGYRAAV